MNEKLMEKSVEKSMKNECKIHEKWMEKSMENERKINRKWMKISLSPANTCSRNTCSRNTCSGVDYSTRALRARSARGARAAGRAKRGRFFCFLIDFWYVFLLFGCLFELEAMENPLQNPLKNSLKFSRFNAKSTARRRKIVRAPKIAMRQFPHANL